MAYVWAPVSGTITSTNCFCNCYAGEPSCPQPSDCPSGSACRHAPSSYWLGVYPGPEDIGARQDTQVYFSASNYVLSIKFLRKRICKTLPESDKATEALEVDMYSQPNASGTLLGKILYGHVTNRVPLDGEVRNISSYANNWDNMPSIGTIAPTATAAWCSTGPHVHLECSSNGSRNGLCCGNGTSAKGTLIYIYS